MTGGETLFVRLNLNFSRPVTKSLKTFLELEVCYVCEAGSDSSDCTLVEEEAEFGAKWFLSILMFINKHAAAAGERLCSDHYYFYLPS